MPHPELVSGCPLNTRLQFFFFFLVTVCFTYFKKIIADTTVVVFFFFLVYIILDHCSTWDLIDCNGLNSILPGEQLFCWLKSLCFIFIFNPEQCCHQKTSAHSHQSISKPSGLVKECHFGLPRYKNLPLIIKKNILYFRILPESVMWTLWYSIHIRAHLREMTSIDDFQKDMQHVFFLTCLGQVRPSEGHILDCNVLNSPRIVFVLVTSFLRYKCSLKVSNSVVFSF